MSYASTDKNLKGENHTLLHKYYSKPHSERLVTTIGIKIAPTTMRIISGHLSISKCMNTVENFYNPFRELENLYEHSSYARATFQCNQWLSDNGKAAEMN